MKKASRHHWNYFLAIEDSLIRIARFIEFNNDNLNTYSIELAHILLTASSENDVLLKQICNKIEKHKKVNNINQYSTIIKEKIPEFINEKIYLHQYGLEYTPWLNWGKDSTPNWWKSHNNVKHQRDNYFNEANLYNALNAVSALLITVTYFYKLVLQEEYNEKSITIDINKTCELLFPKTGLFYFKNEYHRHLTYFF